MARSPGFHKSSGIFFGPLSPCGLWPCPLYPSLFPAARITLPIKYWLTGKDKERMSCPGPGVSEYEQLGNERLMEPCGNILHRVPENVSRTSRTAPGSAAGSTRAGRILFPLQRLQSPQSRQGGQKP